MSTTTVSMFVRGLVVDSSFGAAVREVQVALFGMAGRRGTRLATTETDSEGRFFLALEPRAVSRLGRLDRYELRVYEDDLRLEVTKGTWSWMPDDNPREIALYVARETSECPQTTEPANWTVSGTVRHGDGTVVSGVTARALHRKVGGEVQLGSDATTASDGSYSISFSAPLPDGVSADNLTLFVRALDGQESWLGHSRVVKKAGKTTSLDVLVTSDTFRKPSTFSQLHSALSTRLSGLSISALDAEDATLLASESGLEQGLVSAYIAGRDLASKLSESSLDEEVAFALVSKGLSPHVGTLLAGRPSGWQRALKEASEENLVSTLTAAQIATLSSTLQAERQVRSADTSTPGSLGLLLGKASGVQSTTITGVLTRLATEEESPEAFWSWATTQYGSTEVEALEKVVQKGVVTINHAPLVEAVAALEPRQLAGLDSAGWLTYLNSQVGGVDVHVPDGVGDPTDSDAVKRSKYANLLVEQAHAAFPAYAVVKAYLDTLDTQDDLYIFLNQNDDFDFETAKIRKDVKTGSSEYELVGVSDLDALVSRLLKLQRCYRLCTFANRQPAMESLVGAGLTSASIIVSTGKAALDAQTTLTESQIEVVWSNAVVVASTSQTLFFQNVPALQLDLGVFGPRVTPGEVTSIPSYSTLFGVYTYSTTDHSRSVLSPAAYFVSLMNWVEERGGLTELLDRRLDLDHIELTPDNTLSVLPHAELVLEILESNVASGTVPPSNTLSGEDLLSSFKVAFPAAYTPLASAVYPWVLPFDLYTHQIRALLEHMGSSRAEVMTRYQSAGVPSDEQISAEHLGLSAAEVAHFTGTAGSEYALWGFASATPSDPRPGGSGTVDWKVALAYVPTLMAKADIELEEVLDLAHADYPRSGGIGLDTSPTGWTYDASDYTTWTLDALTEAEATALRKMLRVRAATGWTLLETGKVLERLGGVDLTELADLQRLLDGPAEGIELMELLSWFADIDTLQDRDSRDAPVACLYDRVFLDPTVVLAASVFDLAGSRDELLNPTTHWLSSQVEALASPLRLSTADARRLVQVIYDPPNSVYLNLASISELYRWASLARVLGRTVEETLLLVELLGSPFTSPTDAWAFFERMAMVEALGTTGWHLNWWLNGTENQASLSLTELGDALGGVRDVLRSAMGTKAPAREDLTALLVSFLEEAESAVSSQTKTAAASIADIAAEATDALTLSDRQTELTTHLAGLLDTTTVVAKLGGTSGSGSLTGEATRISWLYVALKALTLKADVVTSLSGVVGLDEERLSYLLGLTLDSLDPWEVLLDPDFIDLIDWTSTGPTDWSGDFPRTEDPALVLDSIHKASGMVAAMEVTIDELTWWVEHASSWSLLDITDLGGSPSFSELEDTWEIFDLRQLLPGTTPLLVDILGTLTGTSGNVVSSEFQTALSERTGWANDASNIQAVFLASSSVSASDLVLGCKQLALAAELGVHLTVAQGWAAASPDPTLAGEVLVAARARWDDASDWASAIKPVRSALRDKQLAALKAHVIATDSGIDSASDLYGELLIDTEMSACALTSRIKAAISSVQLYVQRAFLGLEANFSLTDSDRETWQWMKNYRVWEAARKVFLWPENWIEPSLRDDKTPLFEAVESDLQGAELDQESAEDLVLRYLYGLDEVNHLRVLAHYYQEDDEPILHVFARTRGKPYTYYYRRRAFGSGWGAWEKIDADVQGQHLVPVVHGGRLLLFWAEFNQTTRTESQTGTRSIVVDASMGRVDEIEVTTEREFDEWEITLSWSQYRHGEWTPTRKSETALVTEQGYAGKPESSYFFRTRITSDGVLHIVALCSSSVGGERGGRNIGATAGGFVYNVVTQDLDLDEEPPQLNFLGRSNAVVDHMGIRLEDRDDDGHQLWLPDYYEGEDYEVPEGGVNWPAYEFTYPLEDAESEPLVLLPHQYRYWYGQSPVIIHYDSRSFVLDAFSPDVHQPTRKIMGSGLVPTKAVRNRVVATTDYAHPRQTLSKFTGSGLDYSGKTMAMFGSPRSSTPQSSWDESDANALFELAQRTDIPDSLLLAESGDATFRISPFYHPYVEDFIEAVWSGGVWGLLKPTEVGTTPPLARQQLKDESYFTTEYTPTAIVHEPYPVEEVDFGYGTAFGVYNWELFFHLPLSMATHLSQQGRYQEAMDWFHVFFDPTNRNTAWDDGDNPLRFWRIKPFLAPLDESIDTWAAFTTGAAYDEDAIDTQIDMEHQATLWAKDPFNPHALARLRPGTYQRVAVMKYLDNLISWGDHLFRQDTMESLNEATQLYLMAYDILGDRPVEVPAPEAETAPVTYNDLRTNPDAYTTSLAEVENAAFEPSVTITTAEPEPLPFTGADLYFTIPANEQLLAYWDTVEDRLFKIRHCMNIEGVVRQLPLFQPPIDPAMLVRAAAQGVSLADALSYSASPLPHYRFAAMLGKAQALNGTVRALGGALLSALEKRDAEALSVIRANQEVALLEAVRDVRVRQIEEAEEQLEASRRSVETVTQRQEYYQGLLDIPLLPNEDTQLTLLAQARDWELATQSVQVLASLAHILPDTTLSLPPEVTWGGTNLGHAASAIAGSLGAVSAYKRSNAGIQGILASNTRRAMDWQQQVDAAVMELAQLDKQVTAAEIRLAIAENELKNHDLQVDNAKSTRAFMETKFTNKQLYDWMVGQLSSLYYQSYQLAFDVARRAERAYQHELGRPDAHFIQYGHWNSLKKGLLAGEKLQLDLERMDVAYMESDKREIELTKPVSLRRLDPLALERLRAEGECYFDLPEALFDLDCPGHYFRRLVGVSVTVATVAQPQGLVNVVLTQHGSKLRRSASTSTIETETFPLSSIVTSTAIEDPGVFSADPGGHRYLPFERTGAVSSWHLAFANQTYPQLDWSLVSDVVLHLRYTARDGGTAFRTAVLTDLDTTLDALDGGFEGVLTSPTSSGYTVVISARRDAPDAWTAAQEAGDTSLTMSIGEKHKPYFLAKGSFAISAVHVLIANATTTSGNVALPSSVTPTTLTYSAWPGTGPDSHDSTSTSISVSPTTGWPDDVAVSAGVDLSTADDLLVLLELTVS